MGHVVIAGEIYSPNLGDGVIAESLAFLLHKAAPELLVSFLDISGRTMWQSESGVLDQDSWWKQINQKLSSSRSEAFRSILNLFKWYAVRHRRCVQKWHPILSSASTLVIGGGQLLMDNCLDFPLKVSLVASLANSYGMDVHFSACGVGKRWSYFASRLLTRPLLEASTITIRDTLSQLRLEKLVPNLAPPASVTFDPAICAADVYGESVGRKSGNVPVGLGIIGLREVNTYAPKGSEFSRQDLVSFWLDIIALLKERKIAFELFTNGTVTDHALAEDIRHKASDRLSTVCPLGRRPTEPRELAYRVSRYRAVIATRLHASIIALSYGIPVTGLIWDDKVRSFFHDTGRGDHCTSIYERNPDAVVESLLRSAEAGIDNQALSLWKEHALRNATTIVHNLAQPGARRSS